MTTAIEYALMAGHAYRTTRDEMNWFPVPSGWTPFFPVPDPTSTFQARDGFEAVSFTNGTDIVISFAGTYDKDLLGDVAADAALGAGFASSQLYQAAEYYMKVKADNPGANITFTGHSLGGGLASLMAVFFNETAVTFDQAPFRNAANFVNAASLMTALTNKFPVANYPQIATWLAPLDRFISSFDPLGLGWSTDGLAARETKVTTQSVQGEFLSAFTALRIGSELPPLTHGDYFSPLNLHSQALLAAFLQSDRTASINASTNVKETLSQVTSKLTGLLAMLFDSKLFYNDPNNKDAPLPNFIERLVRHQTGNASDVATPDAMLSRFTRDLWKLAQDGGLTMDDGNNYSTWNYVGKTLIAFAMQMYYEDTTNATNKGKELFTKVTGGLQFDMGDVSKDFKAAFDDFETVDRRQALIQALSKVKGYKEYFTAYLNLNDNAYPLFTPVERGLINSILPWLRDWYVQAGVDGLNATDSLNRGAFLLGGKGSDALVGGTSADLLVGNAGDDLLMGGKGNDLLLGGTGTDNYVYTTGDGIDTILDSDGKGRIAMDGAILAGGAQYGDSRVHRDTDNHLYVQVDAKTLIIDGNLIVKNYTAGETSLELSMDSTPANGGPGSPTIVGDLAAIDFEPAPGIQTHLDALGNVIVNSSQPEAGRADRLNGSDGGDIIAGHAGGDILIGKSGNDRLYGATPISDAAAIAQGDTQTGSGSKGDWLAGGTGDDTLIGSNSNDVLSGGAGSDLLIAGAGDDDILGDSDYVAASFEWTVTDQDGYRVFYPTVGAITNPANSTADVIYAGAGNDYVWAGAGNDVVFGEGGNDRLSGNEGTGADTVHGGAENDFIFGMDQGDVLMSVAANDCTYSIEKRAA